MRFLPLSLVLSLWILATESRPMELFQDEDMYQAIFTNYMREYNKEYATWDPEHPLVQKRYKAFTMNLKRITLHNRLYEEGATSFTLGINALADLEDEEYRETYLGYKRNSVKDRKVETFSRANYSVEDLPESWDWREKDAVTPVKNQGMCGSCWAFSAVASMECAYQQATGKLVSFSEQELVDCVLGGIDTCNHGGEMQDGFEEIIKNHGGKIDPEEVYAYTGSSKGQCHAVDNKALGHFTSYVNVTSGDEEAAKAAVTKNVLSIAIDASSFLFQLYRHGVFNWPLCKNKPTDLDHGVALVGYGVKKGKDFWLVKNSWGSGWGMHGYIMMSRNKKNQCGVATDASYPIMKKQQEE